VDRDWSLEKGQALSRSILQDVDLVLAGDMYAAWANKHTIDANKVQLERAGKRRPTVGDPWGRCFVESIRAGLAAEAQLPLPPLPSLVELGRNVMFTAWNPTAALRTPADWKVALSADPAFDAAARAAAPALKKRGLLAVWGVQTQIGAKRIRDFAGQVQADYVIFQAETAEEYDTAIAAGASLIVGNPNAWTDAQRADCTTRCNAGNLAVLFEVYTNAGNPWPDTASSRGVPIACEVLGVGWGDNPYQIDDYLNHTPAGVFATASVYLAETLDDDSWGRL